MSLVRKALQEFCQNAPLAEWLLAACGVALAIETVIILALRRGSDADAGTAGGPVVQRWRPLVSLILSGIVAVGFPLLVRASVVRSWDRIQGALPLASGAERGTAFSLAMSTLLDTWSLACVLVPPIELLACFGIGLSLAELGSMKLQPSAGKGAPRALRHWHGGEIAIVLAMFLLSSIGPVVRGGTWQTTAIRHGFEAVAKSPPAAKLRVMDSMLAKAQTQLDDRARWALPGTFLAVGVSVALLLSRVRRRPRSSADEEMQAWRRTLIFAFLCLLAGTGLWAWSAPLKAEADMPFPLPANVPVVRLPKDLPPTIDFVGPDELDTGPLAEIRSRGTTVEGILVEDDELVRQFRISTAWQLSHGKPPVQVEADTVSIVMARDAPMQRLDLVLGAAREARYSRAVFVSPRVESMERPVLGRIERQIPTAAMAWLTTRPGLDAGTGARVSTMDMRNYPDYGTFVRELVRRRQDGMQVMLSLP